MDAGILPIKDPFNAKRRLMTAFDDRERISIAQALIEDALWLCSQSPFLEWWVVSDSTEVLDRAAAEGLATVQDAGTDLNGALNLAIAEVLKAGADSVTIVPGDVPLATVEDLQDLLDTGAASDMVVVPSADDGGTNGLFLSPPDLIAVVFGPGSLRAHLAAAESAGHRCSVLVLDRLALDLDTPDDIEPLLAAEMERPSQTIDLLREIHT